MSKLELELNVDSFRPGDINVNKVAPGRARERDRIGQVRLGWVRLD